jgi:hypothetical protein
MGVCLRSSVGTPREKRVNVEIIYWRKRRTRRNKFVVPNVDDFI